MMAKEAWVLLADAFRRAGRYREAGEARREILDRFGPVLSQEERTNCENQIGLWSALADIPPQEVEVGEGTTIRMTNRQFPVRVKNRTFFVGYDTGANLSVLYKSIADELGVAIYGPAIKIQSGTGQWIDGRTGVVPEMRLGSIIIRNGLGTGLAVWVAVCMGSLLEDRCRWLRWMNCRPSVLGNEVSRSPFRVSSFA